MADFLGPVLLASTWLVWTAATLGIGLLLAPLILKPAPREVALLMRSALWLGLLSLVLVSLLLNFFLPLKGPIPQLAAFSWLIVGLTSLGWRCTRSATQLRVASTRLRHATSSTVGLLFALLVVSFLLTAFFAAAEPMDYDAGLYRMGLINYATEYRVIPGLANLHDRFGFGSSLSALSAFLGSLVWDDNSYRVISGFFVTVFWTEVGLRIAVPRRRTSGDFLVILAWGFMFWLILSDSGRWIPSPAQDLLAFIAGVGAVGFLVDYLTKRHGHEWLAAVALAAAAVSGSVRPLGWILFFGILLVVIIKHGLRLSSLRNQWKSIRKLVPVAGLAVAVALAGAIRDGLTSGWVLFPLSFFPLPVDWLAPEPNLTSASITWWGRAPGLSIQEAQSINWFEPWLSSFLQSREFNFVFAAAIVSLLPLLWSSGRNAWRRSWAPALLALLPVVLVGLAWFLTAPDVRFGWTPLFAVGAVPLSFVLAQGAYPRAIYKTIFFVVVAVGFLTEWRLGHFEQRGNRPEPFNIQVLGQDLRVMLGPPNEVVTVEGNLGDGTPVVYPLNGENCYMAFPLCLLPGTGGSVEMRGDSIQEGFRQIQ